MANLYPERWKALAVKGWRFTPVDEPFEGYVGVTMRRQNAGIFQAETIMVIAFPEDDGRIENDLLTEMEKFDLTSTSE